MATKQFKLFETIDKHNIVRVNNSRYILEHGAKNSAKTKNRIYWALEMASVYMGVVIVFFRGTIGELKDAILPEFIKLQTTCQPFWDATVKTLNKTDMSLTLKNGSRILTCEISKKSDPTLSKLTTSYPFTSCICDDAAAYLDEDVHYALDYNMGKVQAFNEFDLHQFLFENGVIKRNRLNEYRGNLEFQKTLYLENRNGLSQFDHQTQKKILRPFSMPNQIIITLNPTNLGYWYTHFYRKSQDGVQGYFDVNYSWKDNEEFLSDSQKQHFESQEKEGGQYYRMFGLGQPVLTADPRDLFRPELIDRCYELGKDFRKNIFTDADGKLKENYIKTLGVDPAAQGEDAATFCPTVVDVETGVYHVFEITNLKEILKRDKIDDIDIRDEIKKRIEQEGYEYQNIGVDKQGSQVVVQLASRDNINVTPFRQAVTGNIRILEGLKFKDLRAEIYWYLKKLMENDKVYFCFDRNRKLDEDLLMIRTIPTEDGTISLRKKEDLRKDREFKRSTDYSDSLAYSVSCNKINQTKGLINIQSLNTETTHRHRQHQQVNLLW